MDRKAARRPRLGFVGLGWIGQHRMRAVIEDGVAEVAAVADIDDERVDQALALAPDAAACPDFGDLLERGGLDGVVIATPNTLHAEQAIAALERGLPVFCQKPLAISADETRRVVDCAKRRDCLLGMDFSYRYLNGLQRIKARLDAGDLGRVYAVSLIFHNTYGPDKAWFYQRHSAGGGCITDLGIHLIDLALWLFDFPAIENISSRCYAGGERLDPHGQEVEDYATLRLDLANRTVVDIGCSWHLPLGQDADIRVGLYGTRGGAALKNVNGSFFDFCAELYDGRNSETLCDPAEEGEWGGRAIVDWARRLATSARFDARAAEAVAVAQAIDDTYAADRLRGAAPGSSSALGSQSGRAFG